MKSRLTILLLIASLNTFSQQPGENTGEDLNSSRLEELSESDENEQEYDYDLQQLDMLRKHPLDINGDNLKALPLLDPLHISNLNTYRALLGDIINIHELQAVPGFTVELIKSIAPYITTRKEHFGAANIRKRLKGGERSFLVRYSFVPEISEGFKTNASPGTRFSGSRPAILTRYKYHYRNLLQYGILIDKDAGEKFLNGTPPLPDFYSVHLFSRHSGILRVLALGDYSVNLGQGLIHWQSQAFRKGSAVINIKRQSETLRPYHSAGEYNFHRGLAVTLAKARWESSVFASLRKLTANISTDTLKGSVITSLLHSGLHRTSSELHDKNAASLFATGAMIKRISDRGHFGINTVHFRYSQPFLKQKEAYNLFAVKGKLWSNHSVDFSYTYRNVHLFGESAVDRKFNMAYISGLMASLGKDIDLSALYRNINKAYQAIYGDAFTESTMPGNECGLYVGLAVRSGGKWKIDVYLDMFSHRWLRYRVDAPSDGFSYLVQATYQPNKRAQFLSRFRYRLKPLNTEPEDEDIHWPVPERISSKNWRNQVNCQVTRSILLRSRVEWCGFGNPAGSQSGHLYFADLVIKPYMSRFSGNVRFQAFEAGSYDARIYVYENDLPYASSTPSYYNNGVRYYVNLKGKFVIKGLKSHHFTVSVKCASTVYKNLDKIGSGSSMIGRNRMSTIKMQILITS